jgi:hypothetical protein
LAGIGEYLHGEFASPARLLAAARSGGGADREVMAFRPPAAMALYRHDLRRVRRSLGAEEAHRLRDQGRAMTCNAAQDQANHTLALAANNPRNMFVERQPRRRPWISDEAQTCERLDGEDDLLS